MISPETAKPVANDWRITLFGTEIQQNSTDQYDEESPIITVPTEDALNTKDFKYIAVLFGADYCPHCKEFAPKVVASAELFRQQDCKLIFASNDRDPEAFGRSCQKYAGIDVIPYDTSRTRTMRDLFDIKTIPALFILKNENFDSDKPTVVTNARRSLEGDPQLKGFPWSTPDKTPQDQSSGHVSAMDRLLIRGKYGNWWNLGHRANPSQPDHIYMDEHAVRIRAGIINIITWVALMNVFFFKDHTLVKVLFPLVAFEFFAAMTTGLTPIAPIGTLGTLLAILLHPEPYWKPAKPKRFAWAIGLILATTCFVLFLNRAGLGEAYKPLVATVVFTCNVFTWLEASAGFCLGCFVYNYYLVRWFNLEECAECKI